MKRLVVVDTSVIILLTSPIQSGEPADRSTRRERTLASMEELRDEGHRFIVPAPVIVELAVYEDGERVAERVLARLGGMHVEPLDLLAARAAGEALRETLKNRAPGESRQAIKFDALIAGIAHRKGADILATADPRHFERHLQSLRSSVQVLNVAAPRQAPGQLRLIDRQPK